MHLQFSPEAFRTLRVTSPVEAGWQTKFGGSMYRSACSRPLHREACDTMKHWWFGEKKHIDESKKKARAKAKNDLKELMENGDEVGYRNYVRLLKPKITDEEMERLVRIYHEERTRHPSDDENRP